MNKTSLRSLVLVSGMTLFTACSSNTSTPQGTGGSNPAQGGAAGGSGGTFAGTGGGGTGTGGAIGTGGGNGQAGSGGTAGTGGTKAGGTTGSGGSAATGGTNSTGGSVTTGGSSATGGTSATSSGGTGSGGSSDAGGSGSGGRNSTGGTTMAAGGTAGRATGGAPGTGGIPGTSGQSGTGGGGIDAGAGPACASTLPAITDYTALAGPFATTTESNTGPDGKCVIYRPKTLGENGFLHAPIVFGPGIGMQASQLSGMLLSFASHGYVVIGTGVLNGGPNDPANKAAMVNALNWILQQNDKAGTYQGKLATKCAISMGY